MPKYFSTTSDDPQYFLNRRLAAEAEAKEKEEKLRAKFRARRDRLLAEGQDLSGEFTPEVLTWIDQGSKGGA